LLVVDDEDTIRELLCGSLRFAGYEVATAGSGAEALRAAASVRPDLMLLDVMMPGGDGLEVVRRMRSAGGPELPHATRLATALPGSRRALTTMSPSRSAWMRCSPASARC
jgi:two-component system OmpR family response regulator